MRKKRILDVLANISNGTITIGEERDIAELLKKAAPSEEYKWQPDEFAELVAFSIGEYDPSSTVGWGGYFGPGISATLQDGKMIESPGREVITREMVLHWRKRLNETKHPILVARYAGLIWDLPNILWGEIQEHEMRQRHIEALLTAIEKDLYKRKTTGIRKLERAFNIATNFNDSKHFDRIKKLIIWYEQTFGLSNKPGLWAFSYRLLTTTKKIKATNEEMIALIGRLENRLTNLKIGVGKPAKPDPWAALVAAEQLADYYGRLKNKEAVRRVILSVGQAYEPLLPNVTGMQAYGWLEKVYKLYRKYHLKKDSEAMLCRLREIGDSASEGMITSQGSIQIPKEELQKLADEILRGTKDEIFGKIFIQFIPSLENAANQIKALAKKAPMQFSFPKVLQGARGRTSAVVGSLDTDLEGNIVLHISESLNFLGLFLHFTLETGEQRGIVTKETLFEFLSKSGAIDPARLPIFERALIAYFDHDYLVFIHLLIPQMEEAIRNLIENQGITVLKFKDDVFNLRTLDDILSEDGFKAIFGTSGEDIQTYMRVLLTDKRGWNIRNELSHGLLPFEAFNKTMADRILHAALLFGMIRSVQSTI